MSDNIADLVDERPRKAAATRFPCLDSRGTYYGCVGLACCWLMGLRVCWSGHKLQADGSERMAA